MFKDQNVKRWVISALVTFLAGFLPVILSSLDTITLETLKTGAVWGIVFAAVRSGIKAVVEFVIPLLQKRD